MRPCCCTKNPSCDTEEEIRRLCSTILQMFRRAVSSWRRFAAYLQVAHVCLSVCLSVRSRAVSQKRHIQTPRNFSCGSVVVWQQATTLSTSGLVDDVTSRAHVTATQRRRDATCVCSKLLARGQHWKRSLQSAMGLLYTVRQKKGTVFLLCASLLTLDRNCWIFFIYIKERMSYNFMYSILACVKNFA